MTGDRQRRVFLAAAIVAGLSTVVFLIWMIVMIGGPRLTDGVDDVGELIAALAAARLPLCCRACIVAPGALGIPRRIGFLLGGR
jgi:hypothetical protein